MKPQAMVQELEQAAAELGVKVSYEALSATIGHGGLCRVKGSYRVIIDKRASPHERAATLAHSLARLDTSNISVRPAIRKLIDYYARAVKQAS